MSATRAPIAHETATIAPIADEQAEFLSASIGPDVIKSSSKQLPLENLLFEKGTEVTPVRSLGSLSTSFNDSVFKERSRQFSSRLVPVSRRSAINDLGVALQEWEGFVTRIGHTSFEARLLDRTRNMTVDTEFAEIPINRVNEGDRDLLRIGGIFYLTIRKRVLITGRHSIETKLVFRRLPAWHASTLERAEKEAEELATFFEKDESGESSAGF